ncbi:hypothetical protein C809_02919 [Lachnospiraceae bacterium MD335]|nr:hypothetical protein C809_02919 [Lachnospiraceae bacterium MD335]
MGVSVGTVAAVVAAGAVCTLVTAHNIYVCGKIADAVVNAAKDKSKNEIAEEGTGVGEAGKEIGDSKTQERPTKKAKSGTGKEKATDVPSWAHGKAPYVDENGKDFAKRLCDEFYGENNYEPRKNKDFSKIKKWGDRGFE